MGAVLGQGVGAAQTGRGNVPTLLTHRREGLEWWTVVTCDETKTQRGGPGWVPGVKGSSEREPTGLGGGESRAASFTEAEGGEPSPEEQSGPVHAAAAPGTGGQGPGGAGQLLPVTGDGPEDRGRRPPPSGPLPPPRCCTLGSEPHSSPAPWIPDHHTGNGRGNHHLEIKVIF